MAKSSLGSGWKKNEQRYRLGYIWGIGDKVMLITIMTIPTIPNLHSNNDSGSSKSSSKSSSSSSSSKNRLLYIISVENVAAFPYQKILLLTLLDNCNKSSNICTYTDAPHITTAITALQRNSRSKINIRTSNNQQPCVSERLRQESNMIISLMLVSNTIGCIKYNETHVIAS
uniref:Uncharacterized protein n=1 Tax=Glossina palpalis gambiensis TaxID=67801 RepID=A0A1B0BT82_9MUSC